MSDQTDNRKEKTMTYNEPSDYERARAMRLYQWAKEHHVDLQLTQTAFTRRQFLMVSAHVGGSHECGDGERTAMPGTTLRNTLLIVLRNMVDLFKTSIDEVEHM